jgi:hypothetical protein
MTSPTNAIYVNEEDIALPTNISSSNVVQVIGERSIDEVEGTLLPVARQIQGVNDHGAIDAVPVQTFEYDTALAEEERELREQALQEPLIAHYIPMGISTTAHNPDSIADDSRNAVKHAERTGIQRSEEEKDAIRKANRKVHAHNYFEQQEFEAANQRARRRNREGLQVSPHPSLSSSLSFTTSSNTDKSETQRHREPGYQVHEYNIADNYETCSYDVKEYKSVYEA